MKTPVLIPLFLVGLMRVGTGIAAPPADLATASFFQAHTTRGFTLCGDGPHYKLGNRVGLFVDYKAMRPESGALSPLETGLRLNRLCDWAGFSCPRGSVFISSD
jgi:hypothetical protein